jgi:hypothetical protein
MIKRAAHISPAYYGLCERGWKRLPSYKRCAMQIKVFEGHRVELVEEAVNHWLKAHPTIEVLKIEPTFPVALNRCRGSRLW